MEAHSSPAPINPDQRPLVVSESGTPLTKSALDSAWQRMIRRPIVEGVIDAVQRFALHCLKHQGSTDSEDKACRDHRSEAMRQQYDHAVPVVKPAVKAPVSVHLVAAAHGDQVKTDAAVAFGRLK